MGCCLRKLKTNFMDAVEWVDRLDLHGKEGQQANSVDYVLSPHWTSLFRLYYSHLISRLWLPFLKQCFPNFYYPLTLIWSKPLCPNFPDISLRISHKSDKMTCSRLDTLPPPKSPLLFLVSPKYWKHHHLNWPETQMSSFSLPSSSFTAFKEHAILGIPCP